MIAHLRTRLHIQIQRLAWRYLPTTRQLECWHRRAGWIIAGMLAAGTLVLAWVAWRWGG